MKRPPEAPSAPPPRGRRQRPGKAGSAATARWPRVSSVAGAPSAPWDTDMKPLEGITVVTLEHAIAAPYCTRQLADLGARVIQGERPGSRAVAGAYDERATGLPAHCG